MQGGVAPIYLPGTSDGTAKKLKQGLVNLSSTLSEQTADHDTSSMWTTTSSTVKANANTQIDAYHDKTSAKDRRKQRQELEKQRRELERQQQNNEEVTDQSSNKIHQGGLAAPMQQQLASIASVPREPPTNDNAEADAAAVDEKYTAKSRWLGWWSKEE